MLRTKRVRHLRSCLARSDLSRSMPGSRRKPLDSLAWALLMPVRRQERGETGRAKRRARKVAVSADVMGSVEAGGEKEGRAPSRNKCCATGARVARRLVPQRVVSSSSDENGMSAVVPRAFDWGQGEFDVTARGPPQKRCVSSQVRLTHLTALSLSRGRTHCPRGSQATAQ